MTRNMSTGVTVEATSSCRDTSAPTAANASAYALKPSTNQATNHTMVLAAAEAGIDNDPVANPTATPDKPMISTWVSPTKPMPSTLPAISCHGRTVASSSSTTRLDFSSTTPCATS